MNDDATTMGRDDSTEKLREELPTIITDKLEQGSSTILKDVTPRDIFNFVKWILGALYLLFLCGGIAEYFNPGDHIIFEACKTILPPIATLVIGYYFAKSSEPTSER